MANPEKHPIGNWLSKIKSLYGCQDFVALERALQLRGLGGEVISHRRLKDWSSGQDLIPMTAVRLLIEGFESKREVYWQHLVARVLALAADFICAAVGSCDVKRKTAQKILHDRLEALRLKIMLKINFLNGIELRKARTQLSHDDLGRVNERQW